MSVVGTRLVGLVLVPGTDRTVVGGTRNGCLFRRAGSSNVLSTSGRHVSETSSLSSTLFHTFSDLNLKNFFIILKLYDLTGIRNRTRCKSCNQVPTGRKSGDWVLIVK